MSRYFSRIGILVAVLALGCSHKPYVTSDNSSAVVSEMLDQVNNAIVAARASADKDAPDITSVQVDLQLGTTSTANTSFPLGMVFPLEGQASEDHLHSLTLVFAPKPIEDADSAGKPNPALTHAVEEIYRSIAHANPHYQFQRGTMQIRCTLESGLNVSSGGSSASGSGSGSGGSSRVVLVPLQFGASASNQSIQTITLTFGPSVTSATPNPGPAPVPVPSPSPSPTTDPSPSQSPAL